MTLFDLEIPTVCREKGGGTEREGKGERMGWEWREGRREGGKERQTDEGRTAAGGCHGNSEDCYTAHVNSVDGWGGASGEGRGEGVNE